MYKIINQKPISKIDQADYVTLELELKKLIQKGMEDKEEDCFQIFSVFEDLCVKKISVEYQPIVDINTNKVFAYEALGRFNRIVGGTIPPFELFLEFNDNPSGHFVLEFLSKVIQVRERPEGHKLFLNLSPVGFSSEALRSFWVDFILSHEDTVVELTEDTGGGKNITDAFIEVLDNNKIDYAIDDFLQCNTVFHSRIFINAKIIKLDKGFIANIRERKHYIEFLKGIVVFCRKENKTLILEGVETEEDFRIAKTVGIIYVQGFYFRKLFINYP